MAIRNIYGDKRRKRINVQRKVTKLLANTRKYRKLAKAYPQYVMSKPKSRTDVEHIPIRMKRRYNRRIEGARSFGKQQDAILGSYIKKYGPKRYKSNMRYPKRSYSVASKLQIPWMKGYTKL